MIMIATLLLTHLQNGKRMLLNATHKYKYCCFCFRMMSNSIAPNVSGISDVADFQHHSRYEATKLIKVQMFNRSMSAAILLIPC